MRRLQNLFSAVTALVGLVVVASVIVTFSFPQATMRVIAQNVPPMLGYAAGASRPRAVPAYLKSTNYTATTTYTLVHGGATVLGCVVINTAGAASSTIKLYNSYGAIAAYLKATIDATQVGRQFCYGDIYSGALAVAVASGGAAPDITITYQGQ